MKTLLLYIFLLGLSVQKYSACSSGKQRKNSSCRFTATQIAIGGPVLVKIKSKA